MDSIERAIVVEVPAAKAFNAWVRFEEWPLFLKAIRRVQQIDERKFRLWTERAGKKYESVVEISLLIPSRRIAWRTLSGVEKSGVVCFDPLSDGKTKLSFKMKYGAGAGWDQPDVLADRLEFHLASFKKFIEGRTPREMMA
jgi:uncharacterized membrane protein